MIRSGRLFIYPAALLWLAALVACAPLAVTAPAPAATQAVALPTQTSTPAVPVMGVGITSIPSLTVPAPAASYPTAVSANGNASGPQRIRFPAGATSTTVSGQLAPSGSDEYVLYAMAGQTMTIDLSFTQGQAILVVWGADGNVLLSDHAESPHFQMSLPSTQDYNIQVKGNPDGNTAYRMAIDIPAASTGAGIQRINFPAGATSVTVSGQLPASGSARYLVNASTGQTMKIDMAFDEGRAILVVWGADGNVLLSDHAEASSFQGVLPSTQDYNIMVKGRPEGNTTYRMTITIPPLP